MEIRIMLRLFSDWLKTRTVVKGLKICRKKYSHVFEIHCQKLNNT